MIDFEHGRTSAGRVRARDLPRRHDAHQAIVSDVVDQDKSTELLQHSVGQPGWKVFALALMTPSYQSQRKSRPSPAATVALPR